MTMSMTMAMPQTIALWPIDGSTRSAIRVSAAKGGGQVDGSIKVSQAGEGGTRGCHRARVERRSAVAR